MQNQPSIRDTLFPNCSIMARVFSFWDVSFHICSRERPIPHGVARITKISSELHVGPDTLQMHKSDCFYEQISQRHLLSYVTFASYDPSTPFVVVPMRFAQGLDNPI